VARGGGWPYDGSESSAGCQPRAAGRCPAVWRARSGVPAAGSRGPGGAFLFAPAGIRGYELGSY